MGQFNDRKCHKCQDNHVEGYNLRNNSSIDIRDWEMEIKVTRGCNEKGKSFELIIKSLLNESWLSFMARQRTRPAPDSGDQTS